MANEFRTDVNGGSTGMVTAMRRVDSDEDVGGEAIGAQTAMENRVKNGAARRRDAEQSIRRKPAGQAAEDFTNANAERERQANAGRTPEGPFRESNDPASAGDDEPDAGKASRDMQRRVRDGAKARRAREAAGGGR